MANAQHRMGAIARRDLPMAQRGGQARCGTGSAALEAGDGSATQFDTIPGVRGVSLGPCRHADYGLQIMAA